MGWDVDVDADVDVDVDVAWDRDSIDIHSAGRHRMGQFADSVSVRIQLRVWVRFSSRPPRIQMLAGPLEWIDAVPKWPR